MKTEKIKELEKIRSEFNERLDALLASEKAPEFEVGKWYHGSDNDDWDFLIRVKEVCPTEVKCIYVSIESGDFVEDGNIITTYHDRKFRLATPSEVQSALEIEAKKRGFKPGITIKSHHGTFQLEEYEKGKVTYDFDSDEFWQHNRCLYEKGQWATIVKEEEIRIGGYRLKYEGSCVVIGCKRFTKAEVETLNNIIGKLDDSYLNVIDETPFGTDTRIKKSDLEQILKGFK